MNHQNVQPSAEAAEESLVNASRSSLAPFGKAHILDGLNDNADENEVMGRLVEMGEGIDADGPTLAGLQAFVAASQVLTGPHANVLRARVERYAFDPESPHRMIALKALSSVSPEAKFAFEREENVRVGNLAHVESAKIRGCCAGHDS